MKVLVVSTEPVNREVVDEALGSDDAAQAELMVVAPAVHESKVRFWASDDDAAIGRAEAVQEESVERLDEEGVEAAGDTGESDPLLAIQDALATFAADRIIVFTHPQRDKAYREEEVVEQAKQRFGIPVTHREVTT